MDAVSCIMCCFKSAKMLIKKKASLSILNPGYASSSGGSKPLIQSSTKFILKFSKIVLIGSSKAYANFFRRTERKQAGKKIRVGFPRYKKHFHSITYPQFGFKLLSQRRLKVSKIGSIPIVLYRDPRGKLKTLTVKRNRAGLGRLYGRLYVHSGFCYKRFFVLCGERYLSEIH